MGWSMIYDSVVIIITSDKTGSYNDSYSSIDVFYLSLFERIS